MQMCIYIYIFVCTNRGLPTELLKNAYGPMLSEINPTLVKNNIPRCQHFHDHCLGPSNRGCHHVNLFINETDRAVVIHQMILMQCAHKSHEVCLHDLNSCSAWPPDLLNT